MITQAEWARRHGFSRQYVSKLVSRGVVRLVDGKIDPAQADAALAALRQPAKPLRRAGAATTSPAPQRISGHGDRPTTSRPVPLPEGRARLFSWLRRRAAGRSCSD